MVGETARKHDPVVGRASVVISETIANRRRHRRTQGRSVIESCGLPTTSNISPACCDLRTTDYTDMESTDCGDRAALLALMDALDASRPALQRDPVRGQGRSGDWAIYGTLGHIYADAGYLLYVGSDESARRWSNVKARLCFCRVTQGGDDEGCLHLDRLPAPHEAGAIREALGIRKRRMVTDHGLSQLERARNAANRPSNAPGSRKTRDPKPDTRSAFLAKIAA